MSKQEQVLQIEPQNELKFRGESIKCDIDVSFQVTYLLKWYILTKSDKLGSPIALDKMF